jgi:hypothetical protein
MIDIVGAITWLVIGAAVGYSMGERHEAARWAAYGLRVLLRNGTRGYSPKLHRGHFYWVSREGFPCTRCNEQQAIDPNDRRH